MFIGRDMHKYLWWPHGSYMCADQNVSMMTSSNGNILLAICAGNSPVPGESPHKGQWRGALLFSFICVWINGWVNNLEAGDLRRNRAHYDVTVMREMDRLFMASIHKAVNNAAAWHWSAKQGYYDWIILTSGHPCQYQFSFFRYLCFCSWHNHFFSWTIFHALDRMFSNLKIWLCNYLFVLWTKVHNPFYIFPVFWVNRFQMTDRLTGHSKVSQWSKVNLFGLQIGRYIQHVSIKG